MSNLNPNTIQDRAAHIMKCFGQDINIQKSGGGSRGGKIIGWTGSGKPVYDNKKAWDKEYKDFNNIDHIQAARHHNKKATDSSGEFGKTKKHLEHKEIAHTHSEAV